MSVVGKTKTKGIKEFLQSVCSGHKTASIKQEDGENDRKQKFLDFKPWLDIYKAETDNQKPKKRIKYNKLYMKIEVDKSSNDYYIFWYDDFTEQIGVGECSYKTYREAEEINNKIYNLVFTDKTYILDGKTWNNYVALNTPLKPRIIRM